jgi:hypothetical protein
MKINVMLVCAAVVAFPSPASAEDAYIESDGSAGAGVNTGFFFGPQSKVEIDCQLAEDVALQSRLFGASGTQNDDTKPECECYIGNNSGWKISFISGKSGNSRQASNFYPTDTQRHRIVLDFYEAKQFQVWTGDAKSTKALSDFPANRQAYPMAFFCRNGRIEGVHSSSAASFTAYTKMRVYRFRVWDAGVLVRDYTPLVKGGIPGFRENCSGQFVTGENIAAFTAGGDVTVEPDDPHVSTPNNRAGYAESGKTIYLDTGYLVKPTTSIEVDYALLTNWATNNLYGSSGCNVVTCSGNNSASQQFYLLAYGPTAKTGYYYWKTGPNGSEGSISTLGIATANGVRRTVAMSANSFDFITAGYTNAARTVTSGITVAFTQTLKIGTYLPMKIYGLKIFESNVLEKDYRPIVTNGVPGFIDVLHPSANLLGSTTYGGGVRTNIVFDAGGDFVCTDGSDESYLEFDGVSGHLINTECVIKPTSCIEADFSVYNTTYNSQQEFFKQEASSASNILARLYINSAYTLSYQFEDYTTYKTGVGFNTQVSAADNRRRQFKLDGANNHVTIKCGEETLFEHDMPKEHLNTGTAQTMKIGTNRAHMRLYRFKISEGGVLQRDYVPCVTNGVAGLLDLCTGTFKPLTGGKVCGKGYSGQSNEFKTVPQPMRLKRNGTGTLTCFAPSAQSYEWYEDGVKIPNATGDSLTLNWERAKAKLPNNVHTYSVKPVYTVFNEKVLGNAVSAVVEMAPLSTVVVVR